MIFQGILFGKKTHTHTFPIRFNIQKFRIENSDYHELRSILDELQQQAKYRQTNAFFRF